VGRGSFSSFASSPNHLVYSGILFTSDDKLERDMYRRIGALSAGMSCLVKSCPVCRGEEGAESEGKAFDLLVHLCSKLHRWSRDLDSDQKNENVDTSG